MLRGREYFTEPPGLFTGRARTSIHMSRHTHSADFGKLTDEVKTDIDETTLEALTALAFAAGKSRAEYIREILHLHVHGHAAVLRSRLPGRE